MINMPYYLRERIKNQVINVIMLGILIITLFPIAWMIYCSVKENTDILAGKIPFSRARNNIKTIRAELPSIFICTDDGGINKFNAKTGELIGYYSARTMATNFTFDDEHIWVSSANRPLIRIEKSTLKNAKDFDIPLKNIDVAKIAATDIIYAQGKIWYTLNYKGLEAVLEFDPSLSRVTKYIDLANNLSPIQVNSMVKDNDILWIGTNKALLKLNLADEKIAKTIPILEKMPVGILRMVPIRSADSKLKRLWLLSNTGAFEFDIASSAIKRGFSAKEGLSASEVNAVMEIGNKIYFGTNRGLSIYDPASKKVSNLENVFRPIDIQGNVLKNEKYQVAEVSEITKINDKIMLGSSSGRVSIFSLKNNKVTSDLAARQGHLVISWRNYIDLWKNINFGLYIKNSFLICGAAVVFAMLLATMSAYAVSRFRFPGSRTFSVSILATQMVPGIMFLIPIYIMFVKFHEATGIALKGSYFGLIFIYSAFFVPQSIWILRSFFSSIPYELEEAAHIDGLSPIQIFWYIVLPLAVPGIIATGIYIFLTAWDELIFAWILTSADTMTIPVGIRLFVGNYQNRFDLMMAAATVATLPVMILFFMLQKHIVKGLTAGAVKE